MPGFTGDVVSPESAEYDSARQVFNGLIDKRPRVVLRCRSRADIVAAAVLEHFRVQMDDADDHLASLVDFGTDEASGRHLVTIFGCLTPSGEVGQAAVGALLRVRGVTTEAVMSL